MFAFTIPSLGENRDAVSGVRNRYRLAAVLALLGPHAPRIA